MNLYQPRNAGEDGNAWWRPLARWVGYSTAVNTEATRAPPIAG